MHPLRLWPLVTQLVEHLARDLEVSKVFANRFVDSFTSVVCKNVRDDGVKIVGFGTFSAVKRKARVGRNPQTGEEIKIPPRWMVNFKPGSLLKEAMELK